MTSAIDAVVAHDVGDIFGLTAAMCAVPSESGDEDLLADAIERRLKQRAPRLEVVRIANNVVARTRFGTDRRIVLGGHIDTVPAAGNAVPRVEGDVLHALGSADMKGGLAAMLAIAEATGSGGAAPRFDVSFVWYEGEEVADERNGLRHLFEQQPGLLHGDFAILLEPTGGWVEAGCQGTIHVAAKFTGVRAHSARPWLGTNAIHRIAPTLTRLAAYEARKVHVDELEYREALQVVSVEGGVANNVVPDECRIVVNRRYAPACSLEDAIAQTEALLSDADEIAVLNASPAAPPNLRNPLVAEFVGTLDLAVRPKLGWTDVARFAARGIPAINFGPGDPALAHTAEERVDRQDVEGAARVLAHFLGVRLDAGVGRR